MRQGAAERVVYLADKPCERDANISLSTRGHNARTPTLAVEELPKVRKAPTRDGNRTRALNTGGALRAHAR